MTEKIAEKETQNSEETIQEQEAQLEAGFQSVAEDTALGDEPKPGTGEQGSHAKGIESESIGDTYDHSPDEIKGILKSHRKMAGKLGTFERDLAALKAEQLVKDSETSALKESQNAQLLKHHSRIKKAEDEFEELTPVSDELEHLTQRVNSLASNAEASAEDVASKIAQGIHEGILSSVHPDWEESAKGEEFRKFMLAGGPSNEEYGLYSIALNDPKADHNEFLADWQIDHPEWWADKGKDLFTDSANASIRILNRFAAAKDGLEEKTNSRYTADDRRQRRLRGSTMPEGSSGDPATVLSDEAGLERGFKRARGQLR